MPAQPGRLLRRRRRRKPRRPPPPSEAARDRGEEDTVVVRFTVARDGHVMVATLGRSSGVPALDAAALAMLQDARVPPLPPSMAQVSITVTLALRYSLER